MSINQKVSRFAWRLCALVAICSPPQADPDYELAKKHIQHKVTNARLQRIILINPEPLNPGRFV
jgi:hypothetical protein